MSGVGRRRMRRVAVIAGMLAPVIVIGTGMADAHPVDIPRPPEPQPSVPAGILIAPKEQLEAICASLPVDPGRCTVTAVDTVTGAAIGSALAAGIAAPPALVGSALGATAGFVVGIPFLPTGLVVGPLVGAAVGAAVIAGPAAVLGGALGAGIGTIVGIATPLPAACPGTPDRRRLHRTDRRHTPLRGRTQPVRRSD